MSLQPGNRLGPYEIVAPLGAGGMGEVYRARDTKLGRDAAIKILPDAFINDPDRVARFEREAQLLAALNHPHIAGIYGLDQSGSTKFLALEFVDGESLAARLARGAMPVDETLTIASQIIHALEAAHEKGIIHRDLKPANIMVTAEGQVKVLDFGLAKAIEPAARPELSHSPTLTFAATPGRCRHASRGHGSIQPLVLSLSKDELVVRRAHHERTRIVCHLFPRSIRVRSTTH